jgi:uncharacterized integral membrane protein
LWKSDGGRKYFRVREGPFLKGSHDRTTTENSWSLLACAAIIALIVLVFIQQSSVKHRAIEAAHERATEQ